MEVGKENSMRIHGKKPVGRTKHHGFGWNVPDLESRVFGVPEHHLGRDHGVIAVQYINQVLRPHVVAHFA